MTKKKREGDNRGGTKEEEKIGIIPATASKSSPSTVQQQNKHNKHNKQRCTKKRRRVGKGGRERREATNKDTFHESNVFHESMIVIICNISSIIIGCLARGV